MPSEVNEAVAAVAESLARLEAASPADIEALWAVRDMSRGYFDRQLIRPARILPSVQPRFDAGVLTAIEPLFRRARDLAGRWGIGSIGGPWLSAEEETVAILSGLEGEGGAVRPAGTSMHESLRRWLRSHQPCSYASPFWREAWAEGQIFSALKKPWLVGFLADMAEHGLLGQSVLDVGAGKAAVSDSLASESRKVVQVDIAAEGTKDNVLLVRLGVEEAISSEAALDEMRAIEKASFDTLICSHILNYVDFRTTIEGLHRIHSPAGRLVIFNQPFEGEAELFSPEGAGDNIELLQFLTGEGYALEYLQAAPWVNVNDYDAGLRAKSLLIVARN